MAEAEKLPNTAPTAAEFEAAFNRAARENPELLGSLIASAVLDALRKLEDHDTKLNKLAVATLSLVKGGVVKGATKATNGTAPARPAGQPRKSVNGDPLTPEEAAVEDMMDNAVVDNSESPTGVAAVAGQGPARRANGGAPNAAAIAPNETRTGGDGKPLTPQEEAIERMMDEAPVENQ